MIFLLLPLFSFARWDHEGQLRLRFLGGAEKDWQLDSRLAQARLKFRGSAYLSNEFHFHALFYGGNGYENKLTVQETLALYPVAVWRMTENLELQLGRSLYDSEFLEIISSNDFEPFPLSFDGLLLNYQVQSFEALFFLSMASYEVFDKKPDKAIPLSVGFLLNMESLSSFIDRFNIYATVLNNHILEPKKAQNMFRGGLGVQGRVPVIDLTGSLVFSGHGKGIEFSLSEGTMYHAEIKKAFPLFFDSSVFAGFHQDSLNYKPWAYNRHEGAGLMDLFLWGNLTYYFVGFDLKSSLADFRLQALDLRATEEKESLSSSWQGERFSQNKGGYELDLEASRKVGESLQFRLMSSLFIPKLEEKKLLSRPFSKSLFLTASYEF